MEIDYCQLTMTKWLSPHETPYIGCLNCRSDHFLPLYLENLPANLLTKVQYLSTHMVFDRQYIW